jgi:hypothetical protein
VPAVLKYFTEPLACGVVGAFDATRPGWRPMRVMTTGRTPRGPSDAHSGRAASHPRRSVPRTPWHVLFAELLVELSAPAFRIETEVELLRRPARADVVILRRQSSARLPVRGLRRLWSWIDDVALVEFKSHREPLRRGDVAWWLALCHMLSAVQRRRGESASVKGVLAIVRRTPTLWVEAAGLGATLREEGGGYLAFEGSTVAAKVIVLDDVSAAERQPLLGLFSGSTLGEPRVQRWLVEHAGKVIDTMGSKVSQTHKDFIDAFLASLPPKQVLARFNSEQRLAGLGPEQRLAGLEPEQRLAGLEPEQRLAGLEPEEIIDALEALPAAAQRMIAERLQNRSPRPAKRARASRAKRRR